MTPDDLRRCAPILDALPDPTLLVGAGRRVLMANPAACELFGAPMVGDSVLSYIRQPEAATALETGFAALTAETRPSAPIEARMIQAGATRESVLRVTVSPLPSGSGLSALLVSLHDVSHVEAAEQQRRDFVANVSHELRSPLTVLSGFIETLKGPARNDPEAIGNFLEIMDREAEKLG